MINKCFNDIIGHDKLKEYLSECIENNNVPQSILFYGTPGIGKTSIAKRLALAVAYNNLYTEEQRVEVIKGNSTNEVLIFNMSKIKNRTELEKVEQNFSVGLAKYGKKVLILDEAHGLSEEQQDSLLVALEHIPNNVYVIMCTTDISKFNDGILSRIYFKPSMHALNSRQIKILIKQEIDNRDIKFTNINRMVAESLIFRYCGIDARKVENLMTLLEKEKNIDKDKFELLIGNPNVEVLIMLLELLKANPVQGLEFIKNMTIPSDFKELCVDVLEIFYGGTITYIGNNILEKVSQLCNNFGPDRYADFLNEIILEDKLTQTKLCGLYIKYNKQFNVQKKFDYNIDSKITGDTHYSLTEAELKVAKGSNFLKGDAPIYEGNK